MIRKIGWSLVALLLITVGAQAQAPWPNKPVKILVPTAPGGTADALARMYAQHLGKVLGQQFYVENRGGAGNVLGIDSVVRSPADGNTLLVSVNAAGTAAVANSYGIYIVSAGNAIGGTTGSRIQHSIPIPCDGVGGRNLNCPCQSFRRCQ
jgi:tripartite-type tricarboxylate transporter receptor subunit TctC